MASSQTGGFDCQFVVPCQELQTECAICLHVVREPYMVSCCGYRFCRVCIENVETFKGNADCPLCKNKFTTLPDKLLERTLKEKLVYCRNKDQGCKWMNELNQLDAHLNISPFGSTVDRFKGCDYVQMNCSYCGDQFERRKIATHESCCPKRPILCTFCWEYKSPADEVRIHWKTCPAYPVPCSQGCGEKCKRNEMKDHIAELCPLTQIKCKYFDIGCETVRFRVDMPDHMKQCTGSHLTLLDSNCQKLEKKLEKRTEENRCLRQTYTAAITKLSHRVEELSKENQEFKRELSVQEKRDKLKCLSLQVTNCPPNTDEHKLRSLFGSFGKMKRVQWDPVMRHAFIYYDNNDSVQKALARHRGSGISLYKTKLQIEEAFYH